MLYKIDSNKIFTGDTAELPDTTQPIPKGYIYTDKEPVEGIQKWESNKWVTLEEYPSPPVIEDNTVYHYSKLKLTDCIDDLGKLEEFSNLLDSNLRLKLRWQASQNLSSDDEDFQTMIGSVKTMWNLTDNQIDAILKQCLI